MKRVYVASSWRNEMQTGVVGALRAAGLEVYDFKHPRPGYEGFHWAEVGMVSYQREFNNDVPVEEYLAGICHPTALAGYDSDFEALEWCDTCVLVLPCGRSAHLELGYCVGAGKRTAILLDGPLVTPELMYRMVDYIAPDLHDLLGFFGIQPELARRGVLPATDG